MYQNNKQLNKHRDFLIVLSNYIKVSSLSLTNIVHYSINRNYLTIEAVSTRKTRRPTSG